MPFSQSLNSLNADKGRFSFTAILIALVILGAWLLWFFLAPIPVYETGKVVGTQRDGRLIAHFPARTLAQLRPGQIGYIQHWDQHAGQSADQNEARYAGQQTATVSQVLATVREGQIEVILYPAYQEGGIGHSVFDGARETDAATDALAEGNIEITVAVDHISPAVLVLRSSGQFIEAAPVSLGSR